jgi:hypothetical protein
MQLKSPAMLPGLPLAEIHFTPLEVLHLPKEQVYTKIEPLLLLGEKNLWTRPEELSKAREILLSGSKDYRQLFSVVRTWHKKLDPKDETHSKALAAWMLINNLAMISRLTCLYKYPYTGLRGENLFLLKKRLMQALELGRGFEEDKELLDRHLFALTLTDKAILTGGTWGHNNKSNDPLSYNDFKRDVLGNEVNRGDKNDHNWFFSPAYGFEREGKWITPAIERVRNAYNKLLRTMPKEEISWLQQIEKGNKI